MGIVLSRLWSSGEHSWHFFVSALHAEYRRLFYSNVLQRNRRQNCLHESSASNDRAIVVESVSTQTHERFRPGKTHSKVRSGSRKLVKASSSSLQKDVAARKRHTTKMFELCDEGVKLNQKAKLSLSSTPSLKETTMLSSCGVPQSTKESDPKAKRFVFPDIDVVQEATGSTDSGLKTKRFLFPGVTVSQEKVYQPQIHPFLASETCSELSLHGATKSSAKSVCERCASNVHEPKCMFTRNNSVCDGDLNVTSKRTLTSTSTTSSSSSLGSSYSSSSSSSTMSTSTSNFHDICIIENPDFTRFGGVYRTLASPNDCKLLPSVETRCRCVSYLSPVKEEHDSDACIMAHPDSALSEVFPVFEEMEVHRTRERRNSAARTPTHKLCCSFSSDSGFGEKLRDCNASSSDHSLYLSTTTSESSDSEVSTRRSSDSNGASELDILLEARNDVFEGEMVGAEAKWEGYRTTCLKFEGESHIDVFKDDTHENKEAKDETSLTKIGVGFPAGKVTETAGSCNQAEIPQDALGSSSKPSRQPLQPLAIRARRKVTFSDDLTGSSSSSSGSCSPPSSSTSSSSSSLMRRFRPAFKRQESAESTTSTSSVESLLAVPLSPASPASPADSPAFVFPGKHCFAEPSEGSDLVLVAEGERFHVHSSVVAWQCHVLLLHVRETKSREVVLPDKRAEDVLSFLNVLYPFCKQNINDRNLEALLDLAHSLGCERVKRTCITYLTGLAQFPHLCPHRHLIASNATEFHHGCDASAHHQRNDVTQGGRVNVVRPYRVDSSHGNAESASSSGASVANDHYPVNNSAEEMTQLSSLCACADTMADRVLEILQLAVKYELDDVYHSYLDVTARMRAEELTTCPRFAHLSPATREDVLTSRVTQLENLVSNISVTRSDLIGCARTRHESYRVTFNGELCLRCMSRNLLREAKGSG